MNNVEFMNLRDQSLPLFLPYTRISSYSVYFLHLLIACTYFLLPFSSIAYSLSACIRSLLSNCLSLRVISRAVIVCCLQPVVI